MSSGSLLRRLTLIRFVIRHLCSDKMPKRPTQNPSDRKTSQNSAAGTPGSYSISRPNLNLNPPAIGGMSETDRAASGDDHRQVEYLETPVKSENDKKEYRLGNCRCSVCHIFQIFHLKNVIQIGTLLIVSYPD